MANKGGGAPGNTPVKKPGKAMPLKGVPGVKKSV